MIRSVVAILALIACPLAYAQSIVDYVEASCSDCTARMASSTGVYILEKGEESLIGRAWLAQNARDAIDVQYFIWSTDNIGILAAEQLLSAAERGVNVRVLVDDLLIDARDRTLLLLSSHPNAQIRVYNPNLSVGVSWWRRMVNAVTSFRDVNLRMHDKTAIFDGIAGITGGRNMADEYFDYNREYNFRDRDVLLLGHAVADMTANFEEFWNSEYSFPVEDILADELDRISDDDVAARARELHEYAANPANFEPEVRQAIVDAPTYFPYLLQAMAWEDVTFISDVPGKNPGDAGLSGGGESTSRLLEALRGAERSVLIQSPYLVVPEGGIELFAELVRRGVKIRISTNSLASTDNIQAFSGYQAQREDLLEAGVEIFEYKPYPALQADLITRFPRIAGTVPIFALHAKSMVIDDRLIYIGTFNLDPRSANLNTEVGILVDSEALAGQLTASIRRDISPGNSWQVIPDFNPDRTVGFGKRLRVWLNRLLPLEPVL